MSKDLKTITILFRATNFIQETIKHDVSKHGLNLSEFGALEVLYHKGPLPVQSICEKVLIANSSMSYVIENLIKKALIEKVKDENDRRIHMVHLSEKGRGLFDEVYPKHLAHMRSVIDVLDASEEDELQNLLKKLGKQ
ncbi:MAG: MarR family transcriptional regulator [Erysipelotrichaceae bacterium]|nr:MarR family transcriptional regulator [Erysipelotrichaceae bacterium]MDP3305523.1 MarR family transcriptional regulator [Erysipelotrichaceae bacterium]